MGKFLTGFLIGAAAGAAIALMYAPQSGEKTRRQLRRGVEDCTGRIRDTAETVSDQATKCYKKTRDPVGDVVDSAQNVMTAAKRVVSFG